MSIFEAAKATVGMGQVLFPFLLTTLNFDQSNSGEAGHEMLSSPRSVKL